MDDPEVLRMLNNPTEGDGFYKSMVKELQRRYDKPRMMHEDFCRLMADLKPIKATCKAMAGLATTITQAVEGVLRLGQADFKYITTSLAVSALPAEIRSSWEDKTEGSKQVPSSEDLVAFLRRKADNPMYREEPGHSRQPERRGGKPQHSKQRGAVNVVVTQPPKSATTPSSRRSPPPPTVQSQPSKAPPKNRGAQTKNKGSPYPPCRYQCPMCNDNHYSFSCSTFIDMTVAQRKEHVRANSLCQNCLKPGHSLTDCRSEYRCRLCKGNHNSLIHQDSNNTNTQTVSGTANVANASPSITQAEDNLMCFTRYSGLARLQILLCGCRMADG